MQLTNSWQSVLPVPITERYEIAETRNAAAVMKVTTPSAFEDLVKVLSSFTLTLDKLTTPGKNKSVVARELDEAFRVSGWREARFDQDLTTRLSIFRWSGSPDPQETAYVVSETNSYGGHKVDNVLGRAALDVEWNPKDGNLDRDLANYVSLHEGGVIDMGTIITRAGDGLREHVRSLIATVKNVDVSPDATKWHERMSKLADDPLGTTTTANFGKLKPRLERGDSRGCPVLAIAITERCYVAPVEGVEAAVRSLATSLQANDNPR